jgi:tRNA (guanine6-N2)-methyltransferase
MPLLLLTGSPGTEDIMISEAEEELGPLRVIEVRKGYGRVLLEIPEASLERIYSMKSIHGAALILAYMEDVPPSREGLEVVREAIRRSGVEKLLARGVTFAVRPTRSGEHEYNSMDLARVAGEVILELAGRSSGTSLPALRVRLNSPSLVFTLDLIEDKLYFGVSLSGEASLHRRGLRIYNHPAALKPTLAYVMIRLSEARDGEVIADPMCGGGTIAIEAARIFPTSRIICMDKSAAHIRGALMNALAARIAKRVNFVIGDARRMHEILGERSVDVVISNPPYGIRMGSPDEVRKLYRSFIRSLYLSLRPDGRAVLITTESDYVVRRAREVGLDISHIRRVRHGDLWASIIVLRKPS